MKFNFFKKRRKKHRQNQLHFILDLSLSIIILILLSVVISLNFYQPVVIDTPIEKKPKDDVIDEPIEEILNPLSINIDGRTSALKKDETVNLKLNLYNQGDENVSLAKLSFNILNPNFWLNRIVNVSDELDYEIKNNNIIFRNIENNREYDISLSLQILSSPDLHLTTTAWEANIDLVYKDKDFELNYPLSNLRYLSETNVIASAYYHSVRGDQLGIGPIPPIVGIPTSYFVFFEVENLGNNLENFLISAQLPNYAKLGNRKSLIAGTYSYNEENKRLIWQVPFISLEGGVYKAGFEVIVTPRDDQVGSLLNIVENISYRFTDSLNNYEISNNILPLNTDLKDDFINQGQGRVID